jgi:hypothetical protein
LEDDNATNAESYLNRASLLIPESKDEVSYPARQIHAADIIQKNHNPVQVGLQRKERLINCFLCAFFFFLNISTTKKKKNLATA